jgi:hypothetical protein
MSQDMENRKKLIGLSQAIRLMVKEGVYDTVNEGLRETYEEIGVKISEKNILKELSWLYVPPSNFIIYPFVAFSEELPQFQKQETEVKEIVECKVSDLLDKAKQKKYLYKNETLNIEVESPSFEIEGNNIWGATAMILSEFISVIES